MSGYFQRLIARSMGAGSDVRPLSPQPYTNLAHEKSPAGNSALLTVINTPRSADTAEVANPAARRRVSPAETTGVTDTPDAADAANANDSFDSSVSIWRHTDASAVTDDMSGIRTAASSAAMDALSESISGIIPQNPPHAVVNRKSPLAQHAAGHEEAVARRDEQTAQRTTGEATEAAEAFHLMPLQSPASAHHAVSPPTGAPFSSFSPARAETAALSQAHLSAARQYRHQPAVSESPTIQVTIGRVEIRAAVASAVSARKTPARSPAMNLDDYLKQRNGERR
ncbi:MAG: hypothetical protein H6939_04980 [Burkholderiales bacterium]|nr:hypothetical protein [Burkholderiales bacterium]